MDAIMQKVHSFSDHCGEMEKSNSLIAPAARRRRVHLQEVKHRVSFFSRLLYTVVVVVVDVVDD
jgi:hypothetical protein